MGFEARRPSDARSAQFLYEKPRKSACERALVVDGALQPTWRGSRRLRRKWACWMRRRITHILPPSAPACAPCEPRGRVWRNPAVALAARCSDPTPGALPCPTRPSVVRGAPSQSVGPASASDPAQLLGALGGAPHCFDPGCCPRGQLNAAAPSGCAAVGLGSNAQARTRNSLHELAELRAFTHYL